MLIRNLTLAEARQAFLTFCRSRGLAKRTLEIYADAIRELEMFLGSPEEKMPSAQELRAFAVYLFNRGLKPTTISIKLRALRAFFNFLVAEGWIEESPLNRVPIPKTPKQLPRVLTPDQLRALIKACNRSTWTGIRNRAIVLLFVDCGLRLTELINLNIGDIDLLAHRILIRRGKGGKDRIVYCGSTTAKALRRWASVRGHAPPQAPFFCTRDGARLDRRNVQRILERLARKAGLTDTKVSPHRLRHTAATLFVLNGGPLPALQELLGHASLKTTEVYLHVASALREIQIAASPVDKLGCA